MRPLLIIGFVRSVHMGNVGSNHRRQNMSGRSQRWSPSFGQFGGLIKLFPVVVHAASLLLAVAGASPGNGVGSIV